MAQSMKVRPSELIGLYRDDEITAYCFDRAVHLFGSSLKAELDSVDGKTDKEIQRRRARILRKWIPEAASSRAYRDPVEGQ